MRYAGDDAVLQARAGSTVLPGRRRPYLTWLLPAIGGGWLLFIAATSAYLLHREFYADRASQLWCGAARCSGLVRPPDDVFGIMLAVLAIALFAALLIVPHRGTLRIARVAMLPVLIAASWAAEALLFAPFFFWH